LANNSAAKEKTKMSRSIDLSKTNNSKIGDQTEKTKKTQ
jgi:hypothetical protein